MNKKKPHLAAKQVRFFAIFSEFVVFYYVFSQFYEPLTYPEGLDYLEIRAQSDEYAQKLLYVMKFANVFVARLFGYYEIFEGEDGQLVGYLHGRRIRYLHLHEGVFGLQRCARHTVGKLSQGVVVIA